MRNFEMEIRKAEEKDVPQVVPLWLEYLSDQSDNDPVSDFIDLKSSLENFPSKITKFITNEPNGFLVALEDREVIGFILSFKNAFDSSYVTRKMIGVIQAIFVRKEYRMQNVASRLVEASIAYLTDAGCGIILAETGTENETALSLFKKFNFSRRGEMKLLLKSI